MKAKNSKKKKILKVIFFTILIIVVFVLSYNVAYKEEAEDISESKAAVAEDSVLEAEIESAEAVTVDAEEIPDFDTGDALPEATVVDMPSDDTWSLILLNRYYKINESYEPHLSEYIEGTGIYLHENVVNSFLEMYNAAGAAGITLTPIAGYESSSREQRNFEKQVQKFVDAGETTAKAQALAAYTVLPVGCSDHSCGLAVDIGEKDEDFAETAAYKWLKENAANYGFIERYTEDKESITKVKAAPWHWRYVGVTAAKEMVSKGVCLEEYVGKVN